MKDTLRRYAAQQANTKSAAKTTPAPRKAATAGSAARHWGLPDLGCEDHIPAPSPAPKAKQSDLDNRMVALLADEAKRISR